MALCKNWLHLWEDVKRPSGRFTLNWEGASGAVIDFKAAQEIDEDLNAFD